MIGRLFLALLAVWPAVAVAQPALPAEVIDTELRDVMRLTGARGLAWW